MGDLQVMHPSSGRAGHRSSYSKSGPKPGAVTSCLSAKTAQCLIALPLVLALFALSLQWTARDRTGQRQPLSMPEGFANSDRLQYSQLPLNSASTRKELREASDSTSGSKPQHSAGQQSGLEWKPAGTDLQGQKLAFVGMTSESYDQIRVWLQYHQSLGVSIFYLFVDGQAARADVQAQLALLPGVTVIPRNEELIERQAHSRIWNETWLAAFFHKPCNHELFVRQSLNMEIAIEMATRDSVDWLLHIDTDELMYPGGNDGFSLQHVLASFDDEVDTVVFPNYESLPESDRIHDPFTEVTLFKRNYAHVVSESYFKSYHTVARGNPNYFITYGNGKSAARVRPGLRPNGAHRWYNYFRAPIEETCEQAAVLHYTYNRFEDLKSRRDRCDCAPTEDDAKRCFILPFDRSAFLAASLKTDEDLLGWFNERLVWNDQGVVTEMLKNGLFVRIFAPQILVRGFQAMNAQTNARGTQDMQLPVLPDPEMNQKLAQQQQQQQQPQQEAPAATKDPATVATMAAAAVADVADSALVQGAAQTVQQAADTVTTVASDATNAVAAQVNAAATS